MQEIFQHTERIKKDITSKIAETKSELSQEMKGISEDISKTDNYKSNSAAEIAMIQAAAMAQKPPEVSLEDLNTIKKMIFEMKDFSVQTDNYVRQAVMTKMEINNTAVEDVVQQIKTLGAKNGFYKTAFDKFETNMREQLDIIHSLNAKINSTKEEQAKFKQDIFERFVNLSEELFSKSSKEDIQRTQKVIELTERFEKNVQGSIDEILAFKGDFQEYKEHKENEVVELGQTYGKKIDEMWDKLASFEETITLNVGGMLKDVNDIKLQLTSTSGGGGGMHKQESFSSSNQLIKFENEIISLKEKLEVISLDLEGPGGLKSSRKAGLEDEVQNIWSFL